MYAHFIQKDNPTTVADLSSPKIVSPPIIAGNDNSVVVGESNVHDMAFGDYKEFSVESWVLPVSGVVHVFNCGRVVLRWNDGIEFLIHRGGEWAGISYKPEVVKSFHVVGVCNETGVALYVDGSLVATASIGDAIAPVEITSAAMLIDDWTAKNNSKWLFGPMVSVDGENLIVPLTSDWTQYTTTIDRYNFVGGSISLPIVYHHAVPMAQTYFVIYRDDPNGDSLIWYASGDYFVAARRNSGVETQLFSAVYDPNEHRYWRIRHADDLVSWETSSDGDIWVKRATWAPTWDMSAVSVSLGAGGIDSPSNPSRFGPIGITNSAVIGTGPGRAVVDGVAVYNRELSAKTLLDHYRLGRTIPPITTNLSSLSATIINFENQDRYLINRSEWPGWEPGNFVGVEVSGEFLYSATGGTWDTFIPVPDYDVIKRAKVSWSGDGVSVSASYDGGTTWHPVASNPGYIPGISDAAPLTVDIRATFAPGARLEWLAVELYNSLAYNTGTTEATATYESGNIVNADQAYDQIEYRNTRGLHTDGNGGVLIAYDETDTGIEPIHAIDLWVKPDSTEGDIFWMGGSSPSWLGAGGNFTDQIYCNGVLVSSQPYEFPLGEWTHVLVKLDTPRVSDVYIAYGMKGSIGNVTIFKESVAGQEQRIYRSYFGGRRMDASDDAVLAVAEGTLDVYAYDWTIA